MSTNSSIYRSVEMFDICLLINYLKFHDIYIYIYILKETFLIIINWINDLSYNDGEMKNLQNHFLNNN